jgi:uncharacterized protein with NAD-binding domain and iron-sulfur cluster
MARKKKLTKRLTGREVGELSYALRMGGITSAAALEKYGYRDWLRAQRARPIKPD